MLFRSEKRERKREREERERERVSERACSVNIPFISLRPATEQNSWIKASLRAGLGGEGPCESG